jgi:hypothetical protein
MESNIPTEYPSKPWQPLFDYLSGLCEIPPTLSEMDDLVNVVEKMIGHKSLQALCDRYEKALIDIRDFYPESNIQSDVVAQEALSGEGDRICPNCNKVFNADRHGCCRECGSDEYQNQKEDKQ